MASIFGLLPGWYILNKSHSILAKSLFLLYNGYTSIPYSLLLFPNNVYSVKSELNSLKDDENPYILETLYYNDSKNLNKLNDNKMLYIDDEEFCIDEDHYNYSVYTVYIPEE